MSLVGFGHVFTTAVEREIAPGIAASVTPLPVLAVLKVAAFLDDPHSREKDAQDLIALMTKYQIEGDRRFTSAVYDAGVEYDCAGAFLLGNDVARLCSSSESLLIEVSLTDR
jgi:predicted nucleotidyltransferase